MIDKVNLNRLIGQALETEKKVKKKEQVSEVQRNEDVVEISQTARKALEADYEDFSEKVKKIKEEIARGTYEVNPDKIVEGFRKFFS
ncbi:flagellar biosynthesis anti-sigma factor FlgM [Hydrogenivirga sp. 128-5-R1-1]|uniref:flagellar biosynthesis anti-sigma factor FlgM n=1 Tax=Hydrogenivirga sp. 128-5-R1-1 TaxID=392423 RepID=UPI00015F362B|nr:flagellar biosynthesis anti-sigma factor FlgM [Hydrogenivirga sp. 128-5-R1-1]EDP76530.1 anti sigma factor FlgM [Hydrogenivirga sp. 128-5-R1-1]